jgi:hypothetical protein
MEGSRGRWLLAQGPRGTRREPTLQGLGKRRRRAATEKAWYSLQESLDLSNLGWRYGPRYRQGSSQFAPSRSSQELISTYISSAFLASRFASPCNLFLVIVILSFQLLHSHLESDTNRVGGLRQNLKRTCGSHIISTSHTRDERQDPGSIAKLFSRNPDYQG